MKIYKNISMLELNRALPLNQIIEKYSGTDCPGSICYCPFCRCRGSRTMTIRRFTGGDYFTCWRDGCLKSGFAVDFVSMYLNIDRIQAMKKLIHDYGGNNANSS